MTAFCSGNTSSPIPGVASTVILTSGVIQSILDATDLAWLSPWIGYMTSVITLDVPTYCATDPPTDPGLTGLELATLIALGPGPLTQGTVEKMTQLIERVAWPSFCLCNVVSTPVITSPAAPSGLPSVNPSGQTGPGTAPPCASFPFSHTGSWGTTGQVQAMVPPGPLGFNPALGQALPAGSTSMLLHYTAGASGVSGAFVELDVTFYDSLNLANVTGTQPTNASASAASSTTLIIPSGTAAVTIVGLSGSGSGATIPLDVAGAADIFCGGLPGQTQAPCCPPDPIATAKLDQLIQLVTLMQRQAVPFAYVTGSTHTGLSGDGSFSIGSIIGLLLNISVPARAGRDAGTPATVFDCGWINFASADGFTERFFVSSEDQLVLPRLPGIYTTVGFSFPSDVTVTATEIRREP